MEDGLEGGVAGVALAAAGAAAAGDAVAAVAAADLGVDVRRPRLEIFLLGSRKPPESKKGWSS